MCKNLIRITSIQSEEPEEEAVEHRAKGTPIVTRTCVTWAQRMTKV